MITLPIFIPCLQPYVPEAALVAVRGDDAFWSPFSVPP